MSEEELLKKYGCNSLSEFVDTYLDCETAFDLLRSQFKEIEKLKEINKELGRDYSSANNGYLRLHSIIKEVREYIEKEQEKDYVICDYDIELTSKDLYNDILEILDKEDK